MNRDEAKNILLLHRPGLTDDDPQIAEALALAKHDPELARWLQEYSARQIALREKFRQIAAPAGLKEQIISEQAAQEKIIFWRRNFAVAAVAALVILAALVPFWFSHHGSDKMLANYQNQMVGVALRGYAMDLMTNNPAQVRAYLAQNHAPADFVLPAALQQTELAGCAVEDWQDAKVSMICFRTGRPLRPGEQSDLWLFVIDRSAVKHPPTDSPQFSKINRLTVATWMQGDKLYLLGTEGDERTIKQYL